MTAANNCVIGDKLTDPAHVGDDDVRVVLEKAQDELCVLKQQRTMLTRRIRAMKQIITALVRFLGGSAPAEELARCRTRNHRRAPGITDTCRKILTAATCPLTAQAVRDIIQETSPTILAHHKDPLASVSTVLGRLAEYGEVRTSISDRGQRIWQWSIGDHPAQPYSPDKSAPNTI